MRLEANFQTFLESAPDAIVVVDREGRIVAVNALTEALFGYGPDELRHRLVEVLVPTRFGHQHRAEREAYSANPRTRSMGAGRDLWGRRKSGDEFPIQISLSPINSEDGTLVISIIRDMTAQRAAETRFRALLESAPDGIVVVDSAASIAMVNSQTERLFGYARDELIGQPVELLVPNRFRGAHVADRDSYLAEPRLRPMGAGRALTGRRRTGEEFPVEISLSPLITDQGRMVMAIVRDITERRRAEEMIEASLREKEALLKEIHHRVKNNLQVTSSLLRLQAASIPDAGAREMFEETENRIRSMALVHEKLYQSSDLSRIDFADYIRTLGDLLFRSHEIHRGSVALEVSGNPIFLSIDDAVPCGLIINELLSNALKHAFPAGRRGAIEVTLEALPDGAIRVVVRDDGAGLPSDFDLLRRETLGLQLVQGLIRQLDGTFTVERRDPGTVFIFAFTGRRS